jgi:hypothetical protein
MSSVVSYNVCDTSIIYKDGVYKYSLPQEMLEGLLSGIGFGRLEKYTEEEFRALCEDIQEIYEKIMLEGPEKAPLAVMTAGAPGAGKTTKMREVLSGKNIAYICPDDVCLRGQRRTYRVDIESGDGSKEARLEAYNKWRPGSNAATHFTLANLIRERYAFYFGTTSSSPATGLFFKFLQEQGYRIKLIHLSAPDAVRWASIQERDETFVQTTEADVVEKGRLLPQRIMDTFLAYADEIEFYYRADVAKNAELAATWIRNKGEAKLGTLEIVSPLEYGAIKDIHNAAVTALGRPELSWEATVEANSEIF